METVKEIKELSKISSNYDFFFIDLWGVIHNGVNLLNNVLEVMKNLKNKKKIIFFLTNAPRRSYVIRTQLHSFGLKEHLYDDVISSGEITWQKLRKKLDGVRKNCFLIGPERDYHLIEGLNLQVTNNPSNVDIIVNTGPWGDNDSLDNYKPILKKLIVKNPLMVCSNPDKTVVRGDNFMICAGLLAEYYESIGGRVEYYGKPFSEIYEHCYRKIEKKNIKILVIGDSLDNDIKGANEQNLDSLFVTSGIHRNVNNHNKVDKEKLDDLIRKKEIFPTFYTRELTF